MGYFPCNVQYKYMCVMFTSGQMYLLKYLPGGPHGLELMSSGYPAISALGYSHKPPYSARFILYGVYTPHLPILFLSYCEEPFNECTVLTSLPNIDFISFQYTRSGELLIYMGVLFFNF